MYAETPGVGALLHFWGCLVSRVRSFERRFGAVVRIGTHLYIALLRVANLRSKVQWRYTLLTTTGPIFPPKTVRVSAALVIELYT